MNIVFACSREYAKYANVMLYSLFENNREHAIHIYVLVQEELQECASGMIMLTESYGNEPNRYVIVKLKSNIQKSKNYDASKDYFEDDSIKEVDDGSTTSELRTDVD